MGVLLVMDSGNPGAWVAADADQHICQANHAADPESKQWRQLQTWCWITGKRWLPHRDTM